MKISESNKRALQILKLVTEQQEEIERLTAVAETDAAVPENARLLSGVSSDPLSQTPAQSDDVRRQTIEECCMTIIKYFDGQDSAIASNGRVFGQWFIEAIRALQPQPNGGWQDISTAPKDGTEIWLWSPRYFAKPCWGWRSVAGRWLCHQGNSTLEVPEPTNWMPIPTPPLPLDKGKGGSERDSIQEA